MASKNKMATYMYRALMREARYAQKNKLYYWVCEEKQIPTWGFGKMYDSSEKMFRKVLKTNKFGAEKSSVASSSTPTTTVTSDTDSTSTISTTSTNTTTIPAVGTTGGPTLIPGSNYVDGYQLAQLLKQEFNTPLSSKQVRKRMDLALDALRKLRDTEYCYAAQCVSMKTTNGVRVEVNMKHLKDFKPSNTLDNGNYFTYRVKLENMGTETVELTGRHLIFEDLLIPENYQEIPKNSPGVVGLLPTLKPGECFMYASGCRQASTLGKMKGSFQMKVAQGDSDANSTKFDAEIAPVHLAVQAEPKKEKKKKKTV